VTKTFVDIVGRDFTGAAFDSAGRKISALDAGVASLTRSFGFLGAAAVGGFFSASTVRSIADANIQVQRFNNSLTVGTGSARGAAEAMSFVRKSAEDLGLDLKTSADQFSKLTAASRGTVLEGQATRDIFLSIAKASTVLGLSADQAGGALTAVEQIISKGKVSAEELRGQLGERLPGAFQIAARSIGVTTVELDKMLKAGDLLAEDLLPALAAELDKTFGDQAKDASQQLNANINRLNTAMFDLKVSIGNSGLIDFLTEATALSARLVKDLTQEGVTNSTIFNAILGPIGFLREQAKQVRKSREEISEEADQVVEVFEKLEKTATPSSKKGIAGSKKSAITESQRFLNALKKEQAQAGLTAIEIRKLTAATLGVSKAANPLIDSIDKTNKELSEQKKIADLLEDDLRKIESITQSVRTEEEKFADTSRELKRLLESGLGAESYTRALKQAEDELNGIGDTTRAVTNQVSQLWKQTGRNVQSTLADSIFNFARDGFEGMVDNAINAAGRIASEFAALRLAQGLGINSLFVSGGAAASGGSAATGSNALSIAGLGASLTNGFSGIKSLLTTGSFSPAPFTNGSGPLIGSGGGFSLATGGLVLGGALLTSEFNKLIANDKKIAGVTGNTLNKIINPLSQIPVIGKFLPDLGGVLTGIFGRGQLKQKETNLIGDFNAEGFEGVTSVKFKAKGGLVRGSKTDRVINDTDSGELLNGFRELSESGISGALSEVAKEASKAAIELGAFLDDSVQGFSKSLRGSAEALGLGSNAIDNFSSSINIASEKGKSLSEEQIAEELARVADEMATGLIPEIDNLSKAGESAFSAVNKLSTKTTSLSNAANVLGLSLQDSSDLISGLSFEARISLVDSLGGVEALNQKTQFFANNFLTDAERVDIASQTVNKALTEFGETADSLSKDEFGELLKSFLFLGEEGAESANKLFDVAGSFLIVKDSADQLDQSLREAAESSLERATQISDQIRSEQSTAANDAFGALSRSIAAEQQDIAEEISVITGHINDLTGVLKSTSSAINTINPISKLGARSLIQDAINDSDFNNPKLGNAISALTKSSTDGFATREEFLRDQAESANSLRGLEESAGAQLTLEEQTLSALESESEQLGGILSNAQSQLDALNNIVGLLSVSDASANFNNVLAGGAGASTNFGFTQIGSPSPANTPTVSQTSDQDILDFANRENVTSADLYNAARDNGLSINRVTSVLGLDPANVNRFLQENDLPRFMNGGITPGGPVIVGEGGQEIVDLPRGSRVHSNSDSKKLLDNSEVVALLKDVLVAIDRGIKPSQDTYDLLKNMTTTVNGVKKLRTAA